MPINFYFFISLTSVIVIISKVVYRAKDTFVYRNRTHHSISVFVIKWSTIVIQCLYLISRTIEYKIILVSYLPVTFQQKSRGIQVIWGISVWIHLPSHLNLQTGKSSCDFNTLPLY